MYSKDAEKKEKKKENVERGKRGNMEIRKEDIFMEIKKSCEKWKEKDEIMQRNRNTRRGK